jgi:16S rRNA (guanine966-N2)-methyltransferase
MPGVSIHQRWSLSPLVSLRNKYGRGRAQRRQQGQLRIIGGTWRSRRIRFVTESDIRPTPDRVRETLFNWLQQIVPGANCLDLYAGSGALGFEALSRGAARATFVDQDVRVVQQIGANLELLEATDRGKVVWSDAHAYLAGEARTDGPFDIVFLDPPYRDHMLQPSCELLERSGALAATAWIYLETEAREAPPALPPGWIYLQSKSAGQVGYHLCRRGSP